ncbi:MAG: hypothetical protein SGILL_006663, partial [Bacillariaceae sp.]
RTSAPGGWRRKAPVVGFSTPNPLPHQLRGGALGALELERARQAQEDKKKRKRDEDEERRLAKQKQEEGEEASKMDVDDDDTAEQPSTTTKRPDPKAADAAVHRAQQQARQPTQQQQQRVNMSTPQQAAAPVITTTTTMNLSDSSSDDDSIWTRFPKYEGPFLIVGSIASVYLTDVLKQIINHERPDGAPLAEPGMPSSHALVSFFLAAAWMTSVLFKSSNNVVLAFLVGAGATIVAWLRVACGYHSWDQIGVGAVLGSITGFAWANLGARLYQLHPTPTLYASWSMYALGSALFIAKTMRSWVTHLKHA